MSVLEFRNVDCRNVFTRKCFPTDFFPTNAIVVFPFSCIQVPRMFLMSIFCVLSKVVARLTLCLTSLPTLPCDESVGCDAFERLLTMAALFSMQNSLFDDQLTNHCTKRAALLARTAAVSMGLLLPLTVALLTDSLRLRFLLRVPTDGGIEGNDD